VQVDTDRHTGFREALKRYPRIRVVRQAFTGWSFAAAGQEMADILASGTQVDGVWTSGTDYTVVNAFKTAGKPLVPVVGADTNEFLRQQRQHRDVRLAAVTNSATVGGVAAALAIRLLDGRAAPKRLRLVPELWDSGTAAGKAKIKANYSPSRPPTYSARLQIKPWTTYTTRQLFGCKNVG
jgi:ribose transport system substrate-binding protein